MTHRTVFFVSDGTGITAEALGLSLISQFEELHFTLITLPFIDSIQKAHDVTNKIAEIYTKEGIKPLVFTTLISPSIRALLQQSPAYYIDFFDTFIPSLENELKSKSVHKMGKAHGVGDDSLYSARIEAINYTLNFDDGARTHGYNDADIILLGVSRCGKTPTSLYLAIHHGLRTANYPLTEENLNTPVLPPSLKPYQKKLFGLTIEPKRLQAIRTSRKPNSHYATLENCLHEIKAAESLFQQEKIPFLDSTHLSIEELSSNILFLMGIERKMI